MKRKRIAVTHDKEGNPLFVTDDWWEYIHGFVADMKTQAPRAADEEQDRLISALQRDLSLLDSRIRKLEKK